MLIALQKGAGLSSWRLVGITTIGASSLSESSHDLTLTMTTLIMIVALIWAAFFIFIVRFELRHELDALLIMFQCSKRGLRFLGVIAFHVLLLTMVAVFVSMVVERSIPLDEPNTYVNATRAYNQRSLSRESHAFSKGDQQIKYKSAYKIREISPGNHISDRVDRGYLLTVYRIWLTAIVYAFLYLVCENLVMFHADMSLVEFVHELFLKSVARLTGIDLSDYPAGEMLFNPLVRNRIR